MKKVAAAVFIILAYTATYAQSGSIMNDDSQNRPVIKNASPVMAAGTQYRTSGWKTLWRGKHYRREWATPVQFPVLNLAEFEGGLKPLKAGGGHETKSLRVLAGNGKEYVLRTVDKSLDILVPAEFKGSFLNHIVNDQISTAHPYAPIAVAQLAGSLSLMHAFPRIYYVPDDPLLEEFRSTFANKLCIIEERPNGKGWEHSDLFGNADDIVNTEKMLKEVFKSSKHQVDQRSFLDVRFFDLIINDWDRHEDQWVWAMKKDGDHAVYTPIARDRDQAFAKTDGVYLYIISRRWGLRALQDMKHNVRDIRGANFSARNLDQQFLNELTKDEWKQAIRFIQTHLTDSSISNAIQAMPAEVNRISGDFLIRRLKQRRDNFMRDGMRYYSIMSKQVLINGSADNERFLINQDNKNEVSITGLRSLTDTFYHRTFYRNETKQINIYGLDGDDEYIINGKAKNRFTIRMIGGEGNNHYTAEKPLAGRKYKVYDSLFQEKLPGEFFRTNRKWDTVYSYKRASVKYDWYLPIVVPGYNPDDEFYISLGVLYKKQQWGKTPFGWQQQFTVDYATGTRAVGFDYKGLFKQTLGKWDLGLHSFYKGPRYTLNYYGLGNETELNGNNRSYFRAKARDFYLSPEIGRTWKSNYLRFGLQYENVDILRSQDKFVTSTGSKLDSAVFSSINFGGVNGQWTFSKVTNEKYSTKGIELTSGFSYLTNLNNTDRNMLNINGAVSFYHTFFRRLIFSHRTGAATLFGDYEFYQANTLGGSQNLRGYWRSRFAGKSSFYQNTELRLTLSALRGYVIRGRFGILGFFDDGRVWTKDESSSKLHTGYGGGLFLVPYNLGTLTLYYSSSREANIFTMRAGFFF